jgi:hypothetical protein
LAFVERDGHRSRYRVTRAIECDDEFLPGHAQTVCHFVDDAGRGLVRDHPVNIVQREAGAFHRLPDAQLVPVERPWIDFGLNR